MYVYVGSRHTGAALMRLLGVGVTVQMPGTFIAVEHFLRIDTTLDTSTRPWSFLTGV